MPSKIQTEGNRYNAQLKKTAADGKVTEAEADGIIKDAKKSFTEVKAHYLVGYYDQNQDKFDAAAKAKLSQFIRGEMSSRAVIEAETGGTGAPKPQPTLTSEDARGGVVKYTQRPGQVSVGGFNPDDATQGNIGDCYFVSSLAAVAKTHPEILQKAITTNRDGSYTVTFYEKSTPTSPGKPVKVTVDGAVPEKNGQLEYIAARDTKELWPEILEKAYAAWKGGYGNIEGGMGANALEALTGAKPSAFFTPADSDPAKVFAQVKDACAGGGCVVALSKPFESGIQGMVADHAYTVLGTEERGGKQYVQLRNPWGQQEPGHDGKDDGIFSMPVEQFIKAYTAVEYVKP